MCSIWIIFVICGISYLRVSALWVTVEDFSRSELANLTSQQEHELMLQKLAKFEEGILTCSVYYEILSISIGNNFFGFIQDKDAARECSAIIRATFECFKNLLIQDRVEGLLLKVSQDGASYVPLSGDLTLAFPLICSDMDFFLKNETLYTTFRDRYKKETYLPPPKTYHYGVAKSGDDEIRAMEELLNDPKMKPLIAHLAWIWITYSDNSKLKDIKSTVEKLAKVPDLSKKVQNIYEKTIDEIIPQMKHVDSLVNIDGARKVYFSYLQPNLTDRLWTNIIRDIPDWIDYLECDQDADSDPHQPYINQLKGRHCGRTHITQGSVFTDVWPVTSVFSSTELDHSTQQQHDIFLKKLAHKNSTLIQKFMYLELLAKSIGHDFFGFAKDETDNGRNNAIVKAAFECISNLKLQTRVANILNTAIKSNLEIVKKTGDISVGFNQVCFKIDELLRSETLYITKRDKYMKEKLIPAKTIHQFGIGNPAEDQIKIIGQFLNDPALRKYWAHTVWVYENSVSSSNPDEEKTKSSISELSKVPSKSEAVQKLYEQSIEEILPLIQDFTYNHILENLHSSGAQLISYNEADLNLYKGFLLKLMVSKINKHSDLSAIFNAFYKRT